jgi:sugar phosphate isomerase/epimerase
MLISIVTDEISSDLETAVELATEWGLRDLELRGYGSQRVPNYSSYQKQRVLELLDEHQARVIAISPGLFKIPYPSLKRERFPLEVIDAGLYGKWHDARSLFDYQLHELLPASIAYAKEIHTTKIIIFSFERESATQDYIPDEVMECLRDAAQLAQDAGIELVIEVEDHYWADTGVHTAELMRKINHPGLGVNWDPGNACAAGDIPFPDGYQAVRGYVRHVHFKDLMAAPEGGYRYCVHGVIDWQGQIRALSEDNYQGFISIEPHLQPKVASAKATLQRLKSLLANCSGEPIKGGI